jgi:ABC-2 type transport system permease protein
LETLLSAPVARRDIFLGKTLPYVVLGMLDVPLVLGVATWGFKVPLRGPLWALILAALVFVCTTVAIGTFISTFAKSQQQAMMGGFLFLFPAIQLSGVMAPLENVPRWAAPLVWLNPLSFFVTLMRHLMLKGTVGVFYWQELGALALLGAVLIALGYHRFLKTTG